MSRLWTILGYLSVVLMIVKAPSQDSLRPTDCADEDYAVYISLLNHLYGKHKVEAVVMLDLTIIDPSLSGTRTIPSGHQAFFRDVPEQVKNDFYARNSGRAKIDIGKIKTRFEALPLSNGDYERLFKKEDGWQVFRERYPTAAGIIGVSLPGIDPERRRALVYALTACGPNCSGGSLFFLTKEGGEWKVVNTTAVWQS